MWGIPVIVGLLVFVATAVAYWIWDRRHQLSVFEKLGVPGPKPELVFGNLREVREKGFHACLKEWRQKYGKTLGYYESQRPVLVTSDVDLMQQITIKQFSKFHARKRFRFQPRNNKFIDMFKARDERWKKLRNIGSQMFLTRRMKEMTPPIMTIMDRVMLILEERQKSGEPFDIYTVFQGMTIEVIKNVAFGIQSNALFDPNDPFLTHCRKIFSVLERPTPMLRVLGLVYSIFPGSIGVVRVVLNKAFGGFNDWFHDTAKVIILDRMKQEGETRKDFIQLMLDVRQADKIEESDLTAQEDNAGPEDGVGGDVPEEDHVRSEASRRQKGEQTEAGKLTMEEMQAQCMLFLLAGYETSSTALGYLAHDLATNPDAQDLLLAEIDDHYSQESVQLDYQSVQRLPYMDFVVKESLRLHTIAAAATNRCTMESTTVSCADFPEGLTLPEGLDVQLNPEDVHLDPEYWGPEDPLTFVPERFEPERVKNRHKMAWMPFGQGPRNCVGMRFALMEIKMMLVRLLKVYKLEKTELTPEKLPTTRSGVQSPKGGVFVRLVKRDA